MRFTEKQRSVAVVRRPVRRRIMAGYHAGAGRWIAVIGSCWGWETLNLRLIQQYQSWIGKFGFPHLFVQND
jgi:hypothetical protein